MDEASLSEVEGAARRVEGVWRIEGPRVIAGVARLTNDLGLAEECAQDALVAALEQWAGEGVPDNPGAWLTAVAKRRAIDAFRGNARRDHNYELLAASMSSTADDVAESADVIRDDLLRLVFTACHPVIPAAGRIALTLKVLGGLTTSEIARAFLVSETAMAQRIVRAKRALAEAQVPFEAPEGAERMRRLPAVLEVIYLIFNEGYSATSGDDWLRPELCEDAMRLGRVVSELMPAEPEVHGLVALMEIQASRSPARTDADGSPILLLEQNRARWDQLLIRRGLAQLERARSLTSVQPGWYTLQAEIAACHARARVASDTDWNQIAHLYAVLATQYPSPVVELNRAVAVSMASGPAAGLVIVDALRESGALANYHLLPSVRANLLAKLGRTDEARAELHQAAAMTTNHPERALLLKRASEL